LARSGKHFGSILNFLRDGSVPLPDTRRELKELLVRTGFFSQFFLSGVCIEVRTKCKQN
jgi:BTB/POZ domain-containing adapter for CUL3-mediated RhoA degradation protein